MGSACCKFPYSPKVPNLRTLFMNCPLQLCADSQLAKEDVPVRTRKFTSCDISEPLPLGTVINQPRRPPRKRKRKISRSRSLNNLLEQTVPNLLRSKSATELRLDISDTTKVTTPELPKVHLSPLVLPVACDDEIISKSAPPLSLISIPSIETSPPQIQELISQNKRTFLATLLEENNNLRTDLKDINNTTSRKSSITESLREFESSLYDMLQDNAEDERSEHSLNLPQVVTR